MGREFALAQDRELGDEPRKRREAAGLSGAELARRMGTTATKISRMELGMRTASAVDVISYLAFCDAYRSAAEDLVALCHRPDRNIGYWLSPDGGQLPDSLRSLIYHESTTTAATWFDPSVVNGLLQTVSYARALIKRETWRSPAETEGRIRIRMERQEILNRPNRARFTFFLHEEALRRQIVGTEAMHEQLLKIVLLSALDHVAVRVVTADAAFGGQFGLFRFEKHMPLVYLENTSSALFLEDTEYVDPYRQLVTDIADIALDGGQSREFIAALASEHDRGSMRDVDVEEEQL